MTEAVARTCEKRTGKTSSLKLKEAKIGILLPKLSVLASGGCFETDCLLPLSLLPSLSFLCWCVGFVVGTDKFVDVYTEITRVTSAGERSWEFRRRGKRTDRLLKIRSSWFDLKSKYETHLDEDDCVEFGGIVKGWEQVSSFLKILWCYFFLVYNYMFAFTNLY